MSRYSFILSRYLYKVKSNFFIYSCCINVHDVHILHGRLSSHTFFAKQYVRIMIITYADFLPTYIISNVPLTVHVC